MEEAIRRGHANKTKQRRSSDDFNSAPSEQGVQTTHFLLKTFACRFRPHGIRQRCLANCDGGTRNRPWSQSGGQSRRNLRLRQREAKPQSCKPKELAK